MRVRGIVVLDSPNLLWEIYSMPIWRVLLNNNEAKCNLMEKLNTRRCGPAVLPGGRGPDPMGLCLLLKRYPKRCLLACVRVLQRSLPPLPKLSTVVLHWLSVWQVLGGGLWQAFHGYHCLWRWLPSRLLTAAPTSTKLGDELNHYNFFLKMCFSRFASLWFLCGRSSQCCCSSGDFWMRTHWLCVQKNFSTSRRTCWTMNKISWRSSKKLVPWAWTSSRAGTM